MIDELNRKRGEPESRLPNGTARALAPFDRAISISRLSTLSFIRDHGVLDRAPEGLGSPGPGRASRHAALRDIMITPYLSPSPQASGNYWFANTLTGATQWEAPSSAAPTSLGASAPAAGAVRCCASLPTPAFCFPPAAETKTLAPVVSAWRAHIALTSVVGVALALVSIAFAGTFGSDGMLGAWSDMSTVTVKPAGTGATDFFYSIRLSGSLTSGSIVCKQTTGNTLSLPTTCSLGVAGISYSTSWLQQTLDAGCTLTDVAFKSRSCSALSGMAGIGILCYILLSVAIVCLGLALAGGIEAFALARMLEKKDDGDGGAALLASVARPARQTWALLLAALACVVSAQVAWAITVTASLGTLATALLAGDFTGGTALPSTPYAVYVLFRPGSGWFILLAGVVAIVLGLRATMGKGPRGVTVRNAFTAAEAI